ncbi:hypothetical protein BLNAU_15346 [Blattamonas nauphoetae]|uniref:Uncharacterized protein n=1 Tax=Blattamonas nauphoetae TaxID=2049346 RepID=A0ABQ9XEL6_9EUKA|nr:hypothetical protein BLNAU_15346 [Blattamonas nauphoetae]
MSAVVLTHDLFEHLAAPTMVGGTRRQLCFAVWTRSVCGHRVPRAAGHDRRNNIRNPRIVVAAGEPDCLQRRRRTRFAVVGDCTSDYVGAREECGSDVSDDDCGAGCVGGVGCGCVRRMRRKGKMDEDEEEGITNAQSNELDMNDNLAVRFMNPQIPHSMTPRKSLTMTPFAGPHPSSSKITDIIHASAAAIHAPPRIGSGEADNVAVPDEPAERLGITRHGHTDELGAADQGERHAIGDKATKDGAGAGGRASGGVDLGCGDVARAYPDHGERRTQHPLDLLPPDDAVSGSGARVCVGSTDADVCSDADRQVGVSGHSVPSFLGCGAKYSGSAGCVPDAAAGGQQLVHT